MKTRNIAAFILISTLLTASAAVREKTVSHERISTDSITSFLMKYGWETDEDLIVSEQIIIPEKFSSLYSEYNKIQQKQGFDLSDYKGCRAVLYTCPVLNYADMENVNAQLIVSENRLIGSDLICTGENGFIKPINTH